jgi:plastocyanin
MLRAYMLSLAFALTVLAAPLAANTYTITSSGFTFSPASLTIVQGDTVVFTLGGSHNAVEVNKDRWDENDDKPNGGFAVPFGGGKVVFNTPGTFYYVCLPHASFGMKGMIVVQQPVINSIPDPSDLRRAATLSMSAAYPNPAPAGSSVSLTITSASAGHATLNVYDALGRLVRTAFDADLPGEVRQTVRFSLGGLPAGLYRCRLSRDGEAAERIMIIQ